MESLHETKADPLGAELSNTQQSSSAFKSANLITATDGGSGWRDSQNIGEAGSGGSGSQQDKIRRDALRSAS